jgi:CRISPR system Cascade subunit CasB
MSEDSYARFITHLRNCDHGELARLRRSLSFKPGEQIVAAVERFIPEDWEWWDWRRQMHYLVAGLFASATHPEASPQSREAGKETVEVATLSESEAVRDEQGDEVPRYRQSFGYSVAQLYLAKDQSPSIEQRFINLLDADEEQLPYRLRQMVQLLKGDEGIRIYWARLLADLMAWGSEERRQRKRQEWARAFYRAIRAYEQAEPSANA